MTKANAQQIKAERRRNKKWRSRKNRSKRKNKKKSKTFKNTRKTIKSNGVKRDQGLTRSGKAKKQKKRKRKAKQQLDGAQRNKSSASKKKRPKSPSPKTAASLHPNSCVFDLLKVATCANHLQASSKDRRQQCSCPLPNAKLAPCHALCCWGRSCHPANWDPAPVRGLARQLRPARQQHANLALPTPSNLSLSTVRS